MKRRRSVTVTVRDDLMAERIRAVKAEHPLWGYRRVWAYLRYRQGVRVSRNRIARIMTERGLMVSRNQRLKARRGVAGSKPRASRPDQYWGMDMTKVRLGSYGWVYVHVVLDWHTKEIVGCSMSARSRTADWLAALEQAVNARFPQGARQESDGRHLHLITDNGCQPTSQSFMKNCATLGIKQIFTTWCNPKGNADTERVIRTLKEDLVWTRDWDNPFAFETALGNWIESYNSDFPHQALNYLTPEQKRQQFNQPNSIFLSA